MTSAPVPLVLDLWATGLSASAISEMIDVPRRAVHRIVSQAREIGDPRSVIHVGKNGLPLGRGALAAIAADPVPIIPAAKCRHGHLKTPENVDRHSNCLECKRARERVR